MFLPLLPILAKALYLRQITAFVNFSNVVSEKWTVSAD